MQKIGSSAFEGCASITTLTLPLALKEINGNAFDKCNSLMDIYCNSATPVKISGSSFSKTTMKEGIVHVKKGYATNYNLHKDWKKFLNIINQE